MDNKPGKKSLFSMPCVHLAGQRQKSVVIHYLAAIKGKHGVNLGVQDSLRLAKSVASLMASCTACGLEPVACAVTSFPPPLPSITGTTWSIHALAVNPLDATS